MAKALQKYSSFDFRCLDEDTDQLFCLIKCRAKKIFF